MASSYCTEIRDLVLRPQVYAIQVDFITLHYALFFKNLESIGRWLGKGRVGPSTGITVFEIFKGAWGFRDWVSFFAYLVTCLVDFGDVGCWVVGFECRCLLQEWK